MPFPLSAEGQIEIPIDRPSQAQHVVNGVEHWLNQSRALDLRWEEDSLLFRGDVDPRRRMGLHPTYRKIRGEVYVNELNPLTGLGESRISFQTSDSGVAVVYQVSAILGFRALAIAVGLLVMPAIYAIVNPWLLLALPVGPSFAYACWFIAKHDFESYLRLAAARGLSHAAVNELQRLRSQ